MSDASKLLAIGLLNLADDEGYFFADPRMVRNALRPMDDDSGSTTVALRELSEIGYISVKKHPSHGDIAKIESFLSHQVINKPKSSTIKELYEYGSDTVAIPDGYRLEGKGMEGNGMEQGREGNKAKTKKPKAKAFLSEDFNQFWKAYPKRLGKGDAESSWTKMAPPLAEVLTALEWLRSSKDWTRDGGQYIPHPATWLNRKGWQDEKPDDGRVDGMLVF